MGIDTRELADGTSVTQRFPWGLYVRARVMCSDGRVRTTQRLAHMADTFFSVPAAVRVGGRTVSGYMTMECRSGSSIPTDDDPIVAKFVRHDYGKNADALPQGPHRPA